MVSVAGMIPAGPSVLENLLPCQGEARYHGPVLTDEAAWDFFERLKHDTAWRQDEVVLYEMLEPRGPIASLSLGAERRFVFLHKSGATPDVPVLMAHGGLLVMRGITQIHWSHCLPKSRRVTEPRINLTFRRIVRS